MKIFLTKFLLHTNSAIMPAKHWEAFVLLCSVTFIRQCTTYYKYPRQRRCQMTSFFVYLCQLSDVFLHVPDDETIYERSKLFVIVWKLAYKISFSLFFYVYLNGNFLCKLCENYINFVKYLYILRHDFYKIYVLLKKIRCFKYIS